MTYGALYPLRMVDHGTSTANDPYSPHLEYLEVTLRFDFATKKGGNEADAKLADPIAGSICVLQL